MRDGAALVPLRATSHTPVPDWLMGMWLRGSRGGVRSFGGGKENFVPDWLVGMKTKVQAVEYTPLERA